MSMKMSQGNPRFGKYNMNLNNKTVIITRESQFPYFCLFFCICLVKYFCIEYFMNLHLIHLYEYGTLVLYVSILLEISTEAIMSLSWKLYALLVMSDGTLVKRKS